MTCDCSWRTSEGAEDIGVEACWLAWEPKTLRLRMLIVDP